jgi:hypothetical protein
MEKKMKNIYLLLVLSSFTFGWEGYDYDSGSYVEIDRGNSVRAGRDIEIYDYKDGEYKDVEVQSVKRYGNNVEVEVYDYDAGEYRTLEMDNR